MKKESERRKEEKLDLGSWIKGVAFTVHSLFLFKGYVNSLQLLKSKTEGDQTDTSINLQFEKPREHLWLAEFEYVHRSAANYCVQGRMFPVGREPVHTHTGGS